MDFLQRQCPPNNYNISFPNQNNFSTAFNPLPVIPFQGNDPKSMFSNNNFTNRNDILHNNLQSALLNEDIREYSVIIDSKDRNYQIYPDPFNYEVKFNPLPKSREYIDGKYVVYEEPAPVINDSFNNVRYIKLETVLLPLYTKVWQTEEKNENDEIVPVWKVNTRKKMSDNLYIVLSIGEYKDVNYRSTNDVLGDSFATIYFDKTVSNTHYSGFTNNGVKFFPKDQLAKIDKLKISFMDPYGNSFCCPHVNKEIKSNMECTCEDPDGDEDTDCFEHNLFHPLNPIFQHHLQFKVGVVEPRLSKKNFT